MKPLHWTKADAKMAAKMGWRLIRGLKASNYFSHYEIGMFGDKFKSDDEAIGWVTERLLWPPPISNVEVTACKKALLLCAGAKRGDV